MLWFLMASLTGGRYKMLQGYKGAGSNHLMTCEIKSWKGKHQVSSVDDNTLFTNAFLGYVLD